jgi:WD40 repeat protein
MPLLGLSSTARARFIASSSNDGTVKLWHAHSHKLISSLERHDRLVAKVAFNPQDDSMLASAGFDNRVLIWQLPARLNQNTLDRLAVQGCQSAERYINAVLLAKANLANPAGFAPGPDTVDTQLDEKTLNEIKRYCTQSRNRDDGLDGL